MLTAAVKMLTVPDFQRVTIDQEISNFHLNLAACERLFGQPIPIAYTRHTSRCPSFLSALSISGHLNLYSPGDSQLVINAVCSTGVGQPNSMRSLIQHVLLSATIYQHAMSLKIAVRA